jgi:tetratricopeptide (TPR) repeat protein
VRELSCLLATAFLAGAAETPAAAFDRAVREINSGDLASAESALQYVLKSAPDHLGALQNLGLVYSRTNRLDGAIAIYRRALATNPLHRGVLVNLGLALVKRESYGEARPVFRTLFEHYPDSPAARDTGLLAQLADNDLLRAVPLPVAEVVRCRVASQAGRFEDAEAQCRAAAHHNPGDAEAYYNLGVALLPEDRADDAAAALERSRQLDATFWGVWFYLGKAKLKQAGPSTAIPLLQKAAELNPKTPTVYFELGLALKAAGRPAESALAMDRVRTLRAQELRADEEALSKR